jgi:hypothetical protein
MRKAAARITTIWTEVEGMVAVGAAAVEVAAVATTKAADRITTIRTAAVRVNPAVAAMVVAIMKVAARITPIWTAAA